MHLGSQPDKQYCMQEAAEEEDDVMQLSSQSESVADSDVDKDYEPDTVLKQQSRSCSVSEEEGGEQSRGWDAALGDDPGCWEGELCEQSKVRLLLQQTHVPGQMCVLWRHTHAYTAKAYTLALPRNWL